MPLLETEPLPTTPLFHYTQQDGLLGILKEDCLRATSLEYLNDTSEHSYGLSLIRAALEERCRHTDGLRCIELHMHPPIFVVSFSENGDLLSQWRAYGGHAGGFALGFLPDHLRIIGLDQNAHLVKCLYLAAEQQEAIDALINQFCEMIAHVEDPKKCTVAASRLAARIKDESFREEREWRLIGVTKMKDLEFRQSKSMLIPYFNVRLGGDRNAYLQEVVVGPTPHRELAKESVRLFLQKQGLEGELVKSTRIPYRNW